MNLVPIKLHTRTTLLISLVIIAVFLVIAYFSNLALTNLSDQQEQQQAQLLAIRICDTVGHHIKRESKRESRRERRKGREIVSSEITAIPDWTEVQEEIAETIAKSNPQLAEVRIFHRAAPDHWVEAIRLPQEAAPPSPLDQQEAARQVDQAAVVAIRDQGSARLIRAVSPVIYSADDKAQTKIATVLVLLSFDQDQGYAAELRSLMWPLMLLALAAISLITYFLFRFVVYKPIERLLLAMSKAEEGNLTVEVEPATPDEIGMLTSRFNRMLGRIRQMTELLNQEQRRLEDRVRDATGEIAERKEQVEEANLRLFEMQRQMTQLERLAAAGLMAAQFAHEVGTPLNLISGHVQLLRARLTDERILKRLDVIASQIERIIGIVRAMLDSTRRPRPHLDLLDVNSLLVKILDATQPALVAHNVALRTEFDDGLPLIEADSDQLQQVFINLISNSLDAMPGGGSLSVVTRRGEEFVIIQTSDNGEGIALDQLDLVFDPFFTTKDRRGTGLGLTIVKQIISEHGGKIEVSTQPGQGTTFRIRLPVSAVIAQKG
jgi:two-component system, NtrC family, sensor kinase